MRGLVLVFLGAAACQPATPTPRTTPRPTQAAVPATKPAGSALDDIQGRVPAVLATLHTPLARHFVESARSLPHRPTTTLFKDATKTHVYTQEESARLPPDVRAWLEPVVADEELYYTTKYGSPLSYARPLDVLAQAGVALGPGSRVLDFGYGYASHLRLLAMLGVDATGVDVDPLLRALYAGPGDQGEILGPGGARGRLRLLDGRFPADPAIVREVGSGYDLVVSKNVLKRGYIHPDRPADDRAQIHLGVSDEIALASFFATLKPGGGMLVYNICPALSPPDKPFVPWSDGRSPSSAAQWEAAGFRVRVFDRDDAPREALERPRARVGCGRCGRRGVGPRARSLGALHPGRTPAMKEP